MTIATFRLSMNLRLPAPYPSVRTKTGSKAGRRDFVDHTAQLPLGREPRPMSCLARSASVLH